MFWRVVKYALDHGIHMICLPSKSTHLLQPLDVGCFGILQTTYERNLNAWLRKNPLSVLSKLSFLDILEKTRTEVYTTDCVQGAWSKARCWPIDRVGPPPPPLPSVSNIPGATPGRLRTLPRQAVSDIQSLLIDKKESICNLLDYAIEEVTKYRNIAPQAETLRKRGSGKKPPYPSAEATFKPKVHWQEPGGGVLQNPPYWRREGMKGGLMAGLRWG